MPPPATAAEARHQKSADGVFNDLNYAPPTLYVADFTVRSADMDALNKPTPASKLPKFLPDPTVKVMEDIYEQEMERQNTFFAAYEESKREGDDRRRAYLRAKGFAEGEIAEIMKEARKRQGVKALDEGMRYAPGGDLTFQHDLRQMVAPTAPASEVRYDIPTVDPTSVKPVEGELQLKPSDLRRYEETTALSPLAFARPSHTFPAISPDTGEIVQAIKIRRKKQA